ncbi:Mpo1 family 2-hydroxy fatty acid dioxygenase [Comamonas composti]|uniref:Mpo1 family 2-hydroxy fatty acid dioxygenase n=1 Tax=Comamonas composti TaxID=408558 RepID=UPI00047A2F1A|nr:Mpo1-like protein [Comamonas composti]
MKTLVDQLAQYAHYHRDPRNIATHYVGVPMIMWAVLILLSRAYWLPGWGAPWAALPLSAALLLALVAGIYYLMLDLRYGLCMALVLAAMLALAWPLAQLPVGIWLAWGLGVFVLGWVIQFVGHYYEGRKPAFFDDVVGLAIGPLFVLAEIGFALGFRKPLQQAVQRQAGPVRRRQRAHA